MFVIHQIAVRFVFAQEHLFLTLHVSLHVSIIGNTLHW